MLYKKILKLIEKISPQARDYVDEMNEHKNVEIIYSIDTDKNKGVFLVADNDDCCIFFASFLNEENIEEIIKIINNKIKEYAARINSKELCFNVYGKNQKIINLVRKLGFISDMEGYHLEYRGKDLPQLSKCNLTHKGFESSMIKQFIDLFDSAYYQIFIDNDWEVNSYAKNEEQFHKRLITLNKFTQVHSFWINNELVGAYIFQQNYITDIVVMPKFQNKGYGSYILTHCIRNMSQNKSTENIRLRVVKSNTGAKKLYERNNFVEIAYFAEHTMDN